MTDVIINDPTLASFYDKQPRTIAAWSMILTDTGENRMERIARAAIHEDAPLLIDDTTKEDDHEEKC